MTTRVATGPTEVAGCAAGLAAALRSQGVDAEVVVWSPSPYGWPADRVLGRIGRVAYAMTAPFRRNVLHYQFGSTWLPQFLDAWWARVWRRTLVVTYHGDDCRLYGVARERFPQRGRAGDPARDEWTRGRVRRLGRLARAALVADLELAAYVTPFYERVYVTPLPLHPDTAAHRTNSGRRSTTVIHAASDPAIKGTERIVEASEAVSRRVDLDFRLLTGVPRARVLEALAQADIVIDQLNSVTSGIFALEAMRRGLPVLGEIDRAALAPYQADLPLVAVTPESLEAELEALVRDPERRARIGAAGRHYVARTHSPERVGRTMLAIYRHARESPPGTYEATSAGIRRLELSLG